MAERTRPINRVTAAGAVPIAHTLIRVLLGLLTMVLGMILVWAVLSLPEQDRAAGLAQEVHQNLPDSGVSNPVTAVLLNFRGYDTLLEIGVLLLAALATWSLRAAPTRLIEDSFTAETPVLTYLVRLLVPAMLVVSSYVVWIGSSRPGGAFQGGAVLTAAGVLLLLAAMVRTLPRRRWFYRVGLVLGFGVFLAVAGLTMAFRGNLLEYPRAQAYTLILMIETLLSISIGVTLVLLFLGAPPETETGIDRKQEEQIHHESV